MTHQLTVSIASFGTRRYANLSEFIKHVDGLAVEAREAGSDVLVLPELVCYGLLWTSPDASNIQNKEVGDFYRRVLTPMLGVYKDAISKLACERGITVVGASFWHEEGIAGRNSAFVFRPDGEILRQDKLHMTRGERVIGTKGGDSLMAFEIEGVKCGLYVCYDVQYPEVTQHLLRQKVEVLFVPSLTDERGSWRVWHSAHARALENQVYVCVSTLVGEFAIPSDYTSELHGRAFVACPIDNRFNINDGTYALGGEGEDLLTATLNLDTLQASREKAEVRQLKDRRPELYRTLS